jgi:hypothetical protein
MSPNYVPVLTAAFWSRTSRVRARPSFVLLVNEPLSGADLWD